MALDSAAQVAAISRLFGFQGTPDDLISRGAGPFFHYTDYNAFANIVMKSDLWLTDARFSNDAEELEHGWSFITELVEAQCEHGATPEVRSLAHDVAAELAADAERAEEQPDAVYVCCFCEKPDLLSQWRGYAANGGGVAIEINPQAFSYLAGADCPIGVMRFWKVFYKEAEKNQHVQWVLNFWSMQADAPDVRAQSAAATLRFFVPTFKNPHFEEEAEWRLIFTPGPTCQVPPKFRTARGLLVPYFELKELVKSFANPEQLGIKNVWIGPGPYKDVNARSARLLLDKYGFPGAGVTRSVIPYRG
jgi:hypothetical protein